jgi:hypothetical protein
LGGQSDGRDRVLAGGRTAGPFTYYVFRWRFHRKRTTLIRLEKQAARRGAINTATSLTQANRSNQMAKANEQNTPTCELSLQIQLRKAGLRLERSGFQYAIVYKNQVLLSGSGRGEGLALEEIAAFIEWALIR